MSFYFLEFRWRESVLSSVASGAQCKAEFSLYHGGNGQAMQGGVRGLGWSHRAPLIAQWCSVGWVSLLVVALLLMHSATVEWSHCGCLDMNLHGQSLIVFRFCGSQPNIT
jgi:hypothetical protein